MINIEVLDWGYIVDYYRTIDYRDFENSELEKIDLENLFEKLRKILSDLENKVLNLYLEGYNQVEIGKLLSLNQQRISEVYISIGKKLRTLIDE